MIKRIIKWWVFSLIIWLATTSMLWVSNADNNFWSSWSVYTNWYWVIWAWQNDNTWSEARIITTIRNAINRVLWILWLIALILCLWWWFQMLTAAWDDGKVKTWTKILKNAAIWLIVIGISWLVVTFVFRIINTVAAS